jgi:hypothetical protein
MSFTSKGSNLLHHLTSPSHFNSTATAPFLFHQTPTKSLPNKKRKKSSQKNPNNEQKKDKEMTRFIQVVRERNPIIMCMMDSTFSPSPHSQPSLSFFTMLSFNQIFKELFFSPHDRIVC